MPTATNATRTISGQTETLIWDAQHLLATVDDPDGDSTFTYDADGTRLLRQTPAGTTSTSMVTRSPPPPAAAPAQRSAPTASAASTAEHTRTPTGVDYIVTDNQASVEQTNGVCP